MTIVKPGPGRDPRKVSENTAMIAVLAAVEEQRQFGPPFPKGARFRPGPSSCLRAHRHRKKARYRCSWTWPRTSAGFGT
jgi:hypothetical protein